MTLEIPEDMTLAEMAKAVEQIKHATLYAVDTDNWTPQQQVQYCKAHDFLSLAYHELRLLRVTHPSL